MTVIAQTFRRDFPEFEDPGVYKDSIVNLYIGLAVARLNPQRWDPNLIDYGTELFVAHYLTLSARNAQALATGAPPGGVQGPISSKAVDKVSASYEISAVTVDGGGSWNMTTYGILLLELARMMGAGGMQISGC